MTTSEFVAASLLKATGKVTTLTSTDTKWIKLVAIGNQYIQQFANENDVDWNSLYDANYSLGTVSATDTFDLDDDIRKLSDTPGDYVRILKTDGNYSEYELVNADRLKQYSTGNFCAQVGRTLVFNKAFTATSNEFGGEILVPAYIAPEPLTSASSEVPVDIPQWLVVMTAAEYVRNDITKQNQYSNLIAEANTLMQRMKDDNDSQVSEVYRPHMNSGIDW